MRWIDWIIEGNHTFHFVDEPATRKYNNIGRTVSYETIVKVGKAIVKDMIIDISELLPEFFGLVIDGWNAGNSSHRLAIYATFQGSGRTKEGVAMATNVLLSATPLLEGSQTGKLLTY